MKNDRQDVLYTQELMDKVYEASPKDVMVRKNMDPRLFKL